MQRPPRVTSHPDGAVSIDGFEQARWGGGRPLCSSVATLALVSVGADDVRGRYDHLMGASGAAFRVQVLEERLCPSSPHAAVGFDCAVRAAHAAGVALTYTATDDAHEGERRAAREAVVASIGQGIPALYEHEESSLIVGYTGEALLLRQYAAREPGYVPMRAWPWRVGLVSPAGERPAAPGTLRAALELAAQLFETPAVGGYACGRRAYARWRELLGDDGALERATDDEWFRAALGNAHIVDSLGDARAAAASFLRAAAAEAPPSAHAALDAAARAYGDIDAWVLGNRRALAPYPWELAGRRDWTRDMRARQIEGLGAIAANDERALTSLRSAMRLLPG
jgi:hypothetical protein